MSEGEKLIVSNKRAFHDYFIEDQVEAGLVLQGTEVKALREGKASIAEAYVDFDDDGEAWINHMQIPPYSLGTDANHKPFRRRKLLLKRREIERLDARVKEKGYTVVPLKLYFRNGMAKIKIGLGKGKAQYDKRETMKKKEAQRDIDRAMSRRKH
ncbi:MAG: SsrA-binding protein SmpB [Deltaproteobacteria bacterium]|nr:SsrA-binding protein SmpB [Deltaproteobacteria bacterium]MCB9488296.1 SsrA-binding protein SmpB [Deltaproteobacteria bacterium]